LSLIAKLSILYYLAIQPIAGKILVSAKRILFLADTKNLGEQAEQEFMTFVPNDDNRKFTELYSVQCLKSSHISTDSQIYISTIQRMYAMLKDEPLDDNEKIPPEFLM